MYTACYFCRDLKRSAKKTLNSLQLSSMNFEFKPVHQKQKRSFLRSRNQREGEQKGGEEAGSVRNERSVKTKVIGRQEWLCELFEASADVNVSVLKREGRLKDLKKVETP